MPHSRSTSARQLSEQLSRRFFIISDRLRLASSERIYGFWQRATSSQSSSAIDILPIFIVLMTHWWSEPNVWSWREIDIEKSAWTRRWGKFSSLVVLGNFCPSKRLTPLGTSIISTLISGAMQNPICLSIEASQLPNALIKKLLPWKRLQRIGFSGSFHSNDAAVIFAKVSSAQWN